MFQRLSSDCEDQIQIILQESALDYRLDPQLQLQCTHEVRVPALHRSKAASCDTMTSGRTSTFVCVCVCVCRFPGYVQRKLLLRSRQGRWRSV